MKMVLGRLKGTLAAYLCVIAQANAEHERASLSCIAEAKRRVGMEGKGAGHERMGGEKRRDLSVVGQREKRQGGAGRRRSVKGRQASGWVGPRKKRGDMLRLTRRMQEGGTARRSKQKGGTRGRGLTQRGQSGG